MPCSARLCYTALALLVQLSISCGLSIASDLEPGSHAQQQLPHTARSPNPGDPAPRFCVNIISPEMEYCWDGSSKRPVMAMMYHVEEPFMRVMWQQWSVQVMAADGSHGLAMRHASLAGGGLIGNCIRCPYHPYPPLAMAAMGSCAGPHTPHCPRHPLDRIPSHTWTACIPPWALLPCAFRMRSLHAPAPPPAPFPLLPLAEGLSPPCLRPHARAVRCGADAAGARYARP